MNYFSLRKHSPEPEPEAAEDEPAQTTEDTEGEQPATRGPLLTGILGPGQWIAARFGTGTAWGAHGVATWAIGHYGGWIAAGIILIWLVAVLLFVPREHLERLADRIEHHPRNSHQTEEERPAEQLAAVLWRLIGNAPGTHLKTLTAHLQAAAPDQPLDKAAVRAKLTALGITVKPSVRDAAGRVNDGVHRDDLRAWEQALPQQGGDTPSGPRSDAVTSGGAKRRAGVATPLSRLRRLLPRGGG